MLTWRIFAKNFTSMLKKERIIIMPHKERQALTKSMGCSDSLMSQVLKFNVNSERASRIRVAAMNLYKGIYMENFV